MNREAKTSKRNKANKLRSILLIDDCYDILQVYRIALEDGGFNVLTAESASQAMEVFSNKPLPELIMLDMQLEDISGMEFLEDLCKKRPDITSSIPIVFLTGASVIPNSMAAGAIQKPVDFGRLITLAHQFIKRGVHQFPE